MAPVRRRAPLYALYAADTISLAGNAVAQLAIPWFVLTTTGSADAHRPRRLLQLPPDRPRGVLRRRRRGSARLPHDERRRRPRERRRGRRDPAPARDGRDRDLAAHGARLRRRAARRTGSDGARRALPGRRRARRMSGWSARPASARAIQQGAQLVGAPLGGILVAGFGATTALWLDAASFLVSAGLVAASSCRAAPRGLGRGEAASSRSSPTGCGSSGASHSSAPSSLMVLITNLIEAPLTVVLAVFAREEYGSAADFGVLVGVLGGAALAGRSRIQRDRAPAAAAAYVPRAASRGSRSATSSSPPSPRSRSRSRRWRCPGSRGADQSRSSSRSRPRSSRASSADESSARFGRAPGPRSRSGSCSAASSTGAIGVSATLPRDGALLAARRRRSLLQPRVPRDGPA